MLIPAVRSALPAPVAQHKIGALKTGHHKTRKVLRLAAIARESSIMRENLAKSHVQLINLIFLL